MKLIYADLFPEILQEDTLYVSRPYSTSVHMCASGCGLRVVLPLGKGAWCLMDEKIAELTPSVHVPKCNSHYWIEDGGIRWSRKFNQELADKYSRIDQERYNKDIIVKENKSLLERILRLFKR